MTRLSITRFYMTKLALVTNVTFMCLVPHLSHAAESIIGGTVGYANYNASSAGLSNTQESGINYQYRSAITLNPSNRLYGAYSYNSDDMTQHEGLLVSYDRLFSVDDTHNIKWFIGASAGFSGNEIQLTDLDRSYQDSGSSYVYGGQVGFLFDLGHDFTSEIGFRYLKHNVTSSMEYNSSDLSVNDAEQIYFGIDFTF
ncbi:outer membrane beta-barrel protein [Shewanella donghaensis]|uniref:outer membrane beta-barrel protein n=1 Tax=Shewanella donghaensis TaxID=238836 RepID=UPI0011844D06|nr:outer membrane beta-barrel protein [Shewanella donghaensis]